MDKAYFVANDPLARQLPDAGLTGLHRNNNRTILLYSTWRGISMLADNLAGCEPPEPTSASA